MLKTTAVERNRQSNYQIGRMHSAVC